ncbi:hypothetical protein [Nonomuraea sp. B1E8]|uniref:hypothetical protein n=1 Tax=unclassified Nonomuraea TaxID=2593643 RepID=UPI00325E67F4
MAIVMAVLVVTTSTASAAKIQNIVPNSNYNSICVKGDKYGSGNVCQTDNTYWTIFRENTLESIDKERVKTVLQEQFGPTDLEVHFPSDPVWTGDNETDLIFAEGDVPGDNEGITWCDDPMQMYACDQHMVRIQSGHYTYGLICHEAGHAVGLLHGQNAWPQVGNQHHQLGCMKKTPPYDAVLGSVNKDNINGVY